MPGITGFVLDCQDFIRLAGGEGAVKHGGGSHADLGSARTGADDRPAAPASPQREGWGQQRLHGIV